MSLNAKSALAQYRESDREKYLDNLFRLQLVAGDYTGAGASLAALRELRGSTQSQSAINNVRWEIYTKALSRQAARQESFDEAFKQSFRETLTPLDNLTAFRVLYSFGTSLNYLEATMRQALDQQKGKAAITLSDAVALLRRYLAVQAYRRFQPLVPQLSDEDDARRYVITKDILVRTPDGASICAMLVRPRETRRLPALLNFTVYADPFRMTDSARLTAAHGYAGVEGLTRGKGCSPDQPVPIEHDGADAAALIDWISRQPWSDGRVGMYGGSYEGFTQWAAAKHLPKALKAMMPSVTFAPGIDFPNPGGIYQSYGFPWPFYTTNGKTLDDAGYNDSERWNRLFHDWYTSGRAYRDLDKIHGTPNPIWNRWVAHLSYDSYWQSAIPYGEEFARVNIPVLTTTGYYDDGQIGALYYFTQHYRYRPNAEHYLVIGPYDHVSGQWGVSAGPDGTLPPLLGYKPDPVSALDIVELRYQWFDYVLRGGPKPTLLKDRVNYEVMGANVWKHAPSLAAMADRRLKFYLSAERAGDAYRLTEAQPPAASIPQTVNFADRADTAQTNFAAANVGNWNGNETIVGKSLRTPNGLAFVSAPLQTPMELSGLFSMRLAFITNKKDFDFNVQLYELKPDGEYFQLSYHWARASYVKDRSRRELLTPGRREQLDFESFLLTSRQFTAGSRLVVVLNIIKRPDAQINYGTGRDVSDETIADAKVPLSIKWFNDSFVTIPVLTAR
ncbi:MAG: CocE/NonD family hydrolase [Acidobacteriota bacterium]|nr:CocE/NonD family hydrolase [Acidobacteriota bacterium]